MRDALHITCTVTARCWNSADLVDGEWNTEFLLTTICIECSFSQFTSISDLKQISATIINTSGIAIRCVTATYIYTCDQKVIPPYPKEWFIGDMNFDLVVCLH